MNTMQALVKSKKEEGLWLEEVPVPTLEKNDVLIRVLSALRSAELMSISTTGTNGRSRPYRSP